MDQFQLCGNGICHLLVSAAASRVTATVMLVLSKVVGAAVAALASRSLGGTLGLDVEKVNVSDQVQGLTWQEGLTMM
jgi:hypothetical protein